MVPIALRGLLSIAILLGVGCAFVLLPPWGSDDWLRRPLSDDAYYYLVLARSVAEGDGLTYGGVAVTGFQPLYLLLCLPIGAIAQWDLMATPTAVSLFNWALYNVAGGALVVALWKRLSPGDATSCVVALSLWLLHPSGQRVALNGMETTLALVAWLAVALVVARDGPSPGSAREAVAHGLALGFAFLARNDAVVLVATYGVYNLFAMRGRARGRLAVAAAAFSLLAAPWLIYTWRVSGSLIPQGGLAEAAGGLYDFGRLYQTGAVLGAVVKNVSPIPVAFFFSSPALQVVLGGTIVMFLAAGVWVAAHRWGGRTWQIATFLFVSLALLAVVYATIFGAGHMAPRWLAPGIVVGVLLFAEIVNRARVSGRPAWRALAWLFLVAVIGSRIATCFVDSRRESPTTTWGLLEAARELPSETTIGSFQSGLLAWARPSVVNLDGKTNPQALSALREGRFGSWLAASGVDVVVDSNLLGVDRDPHVREAFEIETRPDGVIFLRRRARD